MRILTNQIELKEYVWLGIIWCVTEQIRQSINLIINSR